MKKITANQLRAGDIVGSGEILTSVHPSGIVNNKKIHLTLKNPKTGKVRLATWGRYTVIGVKNG
jgi:hypothetical protein